MMLGKNIGNLPAKNTIDESDLVITSTSAGLEAGKTPLKKIFEKVKAVLETWSFARLTTEAKTLIGAVNEIYKQASLAQLSLNGHKESGDHDGRYYKKSEVNAEIARIDGAVAGKANTADLVTQSLEFVANPDGFEVSGGNVHKCGNVVVANLYLTAHEGVMNNQNNLFVGTFPVHPKETLFFQLMDDESKEMFIAQVQPSGSVSFHSRTLPGVRHLLLNATYCI